MKVPQIWQNLEGKRNKTNLAYECEKQKIRVRNKSQHKIYHNQCAWVKLTY